MIVPQLNDSLIQTFDTCATHVKRMEFAKSKVKAFIPLKSFFSSSMPRLVSHLFRAVSVLG